ncbi:ATP-binding protein [Priestia flexa]|uniref:histidine kinase n=1 Tax=Priestia flexa TaxID=86664 RepID=A0A8I1MG33_9BACI|nr:ATP-binding protein [Priestia flexa]MBN8251755.1 two-component sensor histidine kinase [Priestia flexa]RIV10601.1 two-component sensor histidine kinase [Priestia flexa]
MSFFTKDLLINFLFILLPLFLVQMYYLLKYAKQIDWLKNWTIAIFPILSILLCMLFPVDAVIVPDRYNIDLRRIPYILGTLYGGAGLGTFLLVLILTIRFLIGGVGFYVTLISLPILSIPLFIIAKKYLAMSLQQRIIASTLMSLVGALLAMGVSIFVFDIALPTFLWIEFVCLDVIGTLVITVLWEAIRTNLSILKRLVKAEKLEVVSHLAASISHEVRNPLTASRGFMQMLGEDEQNPIKKRYLSIAIDELDRAKDIIDDYLLFANSAPERPEQVDVGVEIQHVLQIMKPLANMNGVVLPPPSLLHGQAKVCGERKKLQQCFINLVKNSIEAMPNGGKLEVKLKKSGETVTVEIHDTGSGMTSEQISRLGEPYFTTKEKGTGLGTMVSFRIIHYMQGKVHVKSEKGKGTCFSIELPLCTKTAPKID